MLVRLALWIIGVATLALRANNCATRFRSLGAIPTWWRGICDAEIRFVELSPGYSLRARSIMASARTSMTSLLQICRATCTSSTNHAAINHTFASRGFEDFAALPDGE